jgi:hypothetical protein
MHLITDFTFQVTMHLITFQVTMSMLLIATMQYISFNIAKCMLQFITEQNSFMGLQKNNRDCIN